MSFVSRRWRSTQDINRILQTVLPDEMDENWGAAQFFVQARELVAAMAVWKRIAAHHVSFPLSATFLLLDMLIETSHVHDAQTVWKQALLAAGIPAKADSGGSLIWNGGFEQQLLPIGALFLSASRGGIAAFFLEVGLVIVLGGGHGRNQFVAGAVLLLFAGGFVVWLGVGRALEILRAC